MKIQSQKDFFSGLMFTGVGTAFAMGATSYNVGDAARMGPGYFPLMLGVVLALLGLLVIAGSLARGDGSDGRIGAIAWRPLTLIICANLAFGVLLGGLPSIGLPAMGLVLAIYALTFIASRAGPSYSFRTTLILATLLAVGSYLVFIIGLKLQFQVWPTFIS
ncbi:MAG: tripartite tricarboxylate transporter TctB family protein [Pseudacidovorax sp.]|uniref:tripartite tricarboxylate transporter TctB family protein n=1 Tax=Pseudacidovorax sp. TaxID=1934311 RepID=UPI001B4DCD38|nr:tripartite tricarboxylate transporter TctB family protein [Pseudacidovorax sp.]MBP6898365.1 tripartite tricarboxylate transporter TctB family protein [Pseudacidovorax sp.]